MGTPWRRFLTPARCGQTTSRIARPNSDDDGSGSPSLGDVTCASGTQLHVGAGDRRVVTTGSAASNDARWPRGVGARIHADCGGSTRLQHTIGGSWRTSHGTRQRSHRRTPSAVPMPGLGLHGAMPGALAPGGKAAAAMHNLPQRNFRLNLRPGRARRLSEAGRHWAPIARQRATREERHSGLAWPTYCNKPKGAPPVMDGMGRTVAQGDRRCPPENEYLHLRLFERPAMGGAGAPA